MQGDPIQLASTGRAVDSDDIRNRRLLCAVVTRAIVDYVSLRDSVKKRDQKRSVEALEWLHSSSDKFDECGVSFVAACDALDLSASAVRVVAMRLRKSDLDRFRHVLSQGVPLARSSDDEGDS